jgi:hypothetical protein
LAPIQALAQPAGPSAPENPGSGEKGTTAGAGLEKGPAKAEIAGETAETKAAAAEPAAKPPKKKRAAPSVVPVAASREPAFSDRLILETGRIPPPTKSPTSLGFTMHGEYQVRYRAMTDLRLEPPQDQPELGSLGQSQYVIHWMRLNPRLTFKDKVAIVGQIDVPRGLVLGDTTTLVGAARDPLAEHQGVEVHPRYLYLEYASPIGLLRVGQQGSHWGMGILANDGDHRTLFGDYQRGSLVERALLATTPMGKDGPLVVALAGDLVFEDNTADLIDDGDLALQGVLAVRWQRKQAELGVYGVLRSQTREGTSLDDNDEKTAFREELFAGIIDVTGKWNARVPGSNAFVFGEAEAAVITGSTSFSRSAYGATVTPGSEREAESIRSFGAAARLGAVRVKGRGLSEFGDLVVQLEWGYASGDANPYDGVSRRFTFDPNHNVGLVLFDQVLAWKTARAATLAGDPNLVRRPAPGLQFLPSRGGVFGTMYLNPTAIVRPRRWLDLKAGVVIGQSTADVVDPYHAGALGNFANYDGGDERSHNLGIELDLGADVRFIVSDTLKLDLGVEGGVLLPGRAFDDARGQKLPSQFLGNIKLGVNF